MELIDAMIHIVHHANDRLNYFNIGVVSDHGATVSTLPNLFAVTLLRELRSVTQAASADVGDVPQFQYSTAKLDQLGWKAKLQSTEAVDRAVAEICQEIGLPCKS